MISKAKRVKEIVKQNPEPARGKLGVSPMDPWQIKSMVAEASETELLHRYLKSRGINPEFVPRDTKIAHSKSAAYLSWRKAHEFDESVTTSHSPFQVRQHILKKAKHMNKIATSDVTTNGHTNLLTKEEVDKADVVSMDIPLLIRMLEYAREDAKTDMDLHKVVEKLINIRNKGILTMADYNFVVQIKEELQIDEAKTTQGTALDKFRQAAAERAKKHAEIEKKQSKDGSGMTAAIDRLAKHLNKEEVVNEMDTYPHPESKEGKKLMKSWKRGAKKYPTDLNVPSKRPTAKQTIDNLLPKINKTFKKNVKENTLDPQAATEAPVGPGEQITPAKSVKMPNDQKKQMTKSARIIKSIYKRKNMKEETYDWEKDDKNTQAKPKVKQTSPEESYGNDKPEARSVMTGGKTKTGQKRDIVEIDPLMQQRPGSPDQFEKPVDKKDK